MFDIFEFEYIADPFLCQWWRRTLSWQDSASAQGFGSAKDSGWQPTPMGWQPPRKETGWQPSRRRWRGWQPNDGPEAYELGLHVGHPLTLGTKILARVVELI